jgi:hypothetical protein
MVMGGLLLLLVGAGLIIGGVGVMTKYKEGLGGIITGCMMFILGMLLGIYGLAVVIFVN